MLVGGAGLDKVSGGAGSDIFVFTNDRLRDVVNDYVDGVDKLSLSGTGLTFEDLIITTSNANAIITSVDGSLSVSILNAGGLIDANDFVAPAISWSPEAATARIPSRQS